MFINVFVLGSRYKKWYYVLKALTDDLIVTGGNTNEGEHGGGGWSYIEGNRAIKDYSEVTVAQRAGHGEVLIIPAIHVSVTYIFTIIKFIQYVFLIHNLYGHNSMLQLVLVNYTALRDAFLKTRNFLLKV